MSWSYSRALVEGFSEANCLDTEQSAQLSMTPMPDQFYSHGKTTEHSRLSRFGMTCEPLTESLGEELLTWFQAGFHAKTYPLPEKAQESTESDQVCGEKWRGWLAKFDPNSFSWKTAQLSLLGDLIESSVILPRSGMTRGGLLWELPMLERPTSGTGCGYWPTPTVCWNYNRKGASKTSGDGLATAVAMSLTRTSSEFTDAQIVKVKYATPTTRQRTSPSQLLRNEPGLALQVGATGGTLNPNWVEWLMGWPIGHTALKPSETAKFRNAELLLGKLLEAHE